MKYINIKTFQNIIRASVFANFLNLGSIQLSNTLLSFLIYPIIARKVGLEAFGLFTVANYFAGLMGTIVNYGTSQSGVKDVVNNNEKQGLSNVFYSTLILRLVIFGAFLAIFSMAGLADFQNYNFFLFSVPMIFSEVLNPMFLYLGKEKLTLYNITNLIGKIVMILVILFLVRGDEDAMWVNFIIGLTHTLIYVFLVFHATIRYRLAFSFDKTEILKLLKSNFYLVGNNVSVHLQQSIMVFSINLWGNPLWLGAYAICDKIIGSVKMMTSSISNSIYPKMAFLYSDDQAQFRIFRNRIKKIFGLGFLAISIGIMIFAGPIIYLVNGNPDPTAEALLRIMAFLPTISAVNSINVLELLIRSQNIFIFRMAIILLILAASLSSIIVFRGSWFWFGAYTLLIETTAVLMYEYVIKKSSVQFV